MTESKPSHTPGALGDCRGLPPLPERCKSAHFGKQNGAGVRCRRVEGHKGLHKYNKPDPKLTLSDLLAENELLRASCAAKDEMLSFDGDEMKELRSQLAELREALGIIETWGGDYITGQSVYEFAGAALARTKGEE